MSGCVSVCETTAASRCGTGITEKIKELCKALCPAEDSPRNREPGAANVWEGFGQSVAAQACGPRTNIADRRVASDNPGLRATPISIFPQFQWENSFKPVPWKVPALSVATLATLATGVALWKNRLSLAPAPLQLGLLAVVGVAGIAAYSAFHTFSQA